MPYSRLVVIQAHEYIIQQLDLVLKTVVEMDAAIKVIRESSTKKRGKFQLNISQEEKQRMIQKAKAVYSNKISSIYTELNKKLKSSNMSELFNPYQIKSEVIENDK
ncbi:MAG: hypothetical protein PHD66_06915 [Eubacteriales bacterium]|nr:hypothetical protein [Eubacteriales bacterium]